MSNFLVSLSYTYTYGRDNIKVGREWFLIGVASIKVWYVGRICWRVYMMHKCFGNRWVEYMDPNDLMDHLRLVYVGIIKEPTIGGLTIIHKI